MSWLFPSQIYYILNQTESKHFIFTIHSLVFKELSPYSNTSLFRHFSISPLLYSDNFLLGYCHTSIFFFSEKNLKNIQNMRLIKTETFVFYFSWSQKRKLSRHAQNRSFACLLFSLDLMQFVFEREQNWQKQ